MTRVESFDSMTVSTKKLQPVSFSTNDSRMELLDVSPLALLRPSTVDVIELQDAVVSDSAVRAFAAESVDCAESKFRIRFGARLVFACPVSEPRFVRTLSAKFGLSVLMRKVRRGSGNPLAFVSVVTRFALPRFFVAFGEVTKPLEFVAVPTFSQNRGAHMFSVPCAPEKAG